MSKKILFIILISLLLFRAAPIFAADSGSYPEYLMRVESVLTEGDIDIQGFEAVSGQRYPFIYKELGLIEIIPSIDIKTGRLVLFFADRAGNIIYKTDNLESNSWVKGEVNQPNIGVSEIGFRDLNGDGLEDLLIVCRCVNRTGPYARRPYTVGDVLFQSENGFYRDWRIADKINRFDMNKDIDMITAYVRDGRSMEFLYTSKTLEELVSYGFEIITSQSFTTHLEKFGVIQAVSGFYNLSGQSYLMVYIVNEDGKIAWNFQPMGDYQNFYNIKGISFSDIDGDGLRDVTILANYVTYNAEAEAVIKADYNIYYQRTGYFIEDSEIKKIHPCTGEDVLSTIIQAAKRYRQQRGLVND